MTELSIEEIEKCIELRELESIIWTFVYEYGWDNVTLKELSDFCTEKVEDKP